MTSFLQVNITRIVVSTIQTALETVFPSSNHGWNLERPANLFPSLVRTQLPAGRRCLQAHAFLPFMLCAALKKKETATMSWDMRCGSPEPIVGVVARARETCVGPGPGPTFAVLHPITYYCT